MLYCKLFRYVRRKIFQKEEARPVKKKILLLCIDLFRAVYGALYAALKCLPLQDKIVMMSRQSNEVRPDFLQIEKALRRAGCRRSRTS